LPFGLFGQPDIMFVHGDVVVAAAFDCVGGLLFRGTNDNGGRKSLLTADGGRRVFQQQRRTKQLL
jgi:hypothetical protein